MLTWPVCKTHPRRPQRGIALAGLCMTNATCERNHPPAAVRQYSKAPSPPEVSQLLRSSVKSPFFFFSAKITASVCCCSPLTGCVHSLSWEHIPAVRTWPRVSWGSQPCYHVCPSSVHPGRHVSWMGMPMFFKGFLDDQKIRTLELMQHTSRGRMSWNR